eukprot:6311892-Prymnesium_polylepis.1
MRIRWGASRRAVVISFATVEDTHERVRWFAGSASGQAVAATCDCETKPSRQRGPEPTQRRIGRCNCIVPQPGFGVGGLTGVALEAAVLR